MLKKYLDEPPALTTLRSRGRQVITSDSENFRSYRSPEVVSGVASNHQGRNVRFALNWLDSSNKRPLPRIAERLSRLRALAPNLNYSELEGGLNQVLYQQALGRLKEILKSNKAMTLREELEKPLNPIYYLQENEPDNSDVQSIYENFKRSGNLKEYIWSCLTNKKESQALVLLVDLLGEADLSDLASSISPSDLLAFTSIPKSIVFFIKLMNRVPWFKDRLLNECQNSFGSSSRIE